MADAQDHTPEPATAGDLADGDRWVTRKEAARLVGCSVSAIRKWETDGDVQAQKGDDGRTVVVWLQDVRDRYSAAAPDPVRHAPDALNALDVVVQRLEGLRGLAVDAAELHAARREADALADRLDRTEHERDQLRDDLDATRQELHETREQLARITGSLSPRQRRRAGLE